MDNSSDNNHGINGNHDIDLPSILNILRDGARSLEWDDATDSLDALSPKFDKHLPLLLETIQDEEAGLEARSYALHAIQAVDPELRKSISVVIKLLQDKEHVLRSETATLLKHCAPQDIPVIVPALVSAIKDIHTTVGATSAAFATLVKLIGFRKATMALFTVE